MLLGNKAAHAQLKHGNTDLLANDKDTGILTVLLGKGDGTFTVGQT
jgi:hypothetical protein